MLLNTSFVCTQRTAEAVGFLFFAFKSVDLLPSLKSVNSCNRSHQLAQANRAKVLLPPPPQHIVRRAVLFYLGGCWRGSEVERSQCRLCICSRTDSTLSAREAGWAFGSGTATTGARPAQQQQQRKAIFFPSLCSREPSRAEGGCQRLPGFFQCHSPFPVFKKLQGEAPPAALLNYSDLWRG